VLLFYISLAALGIAILNIYEGGRLRNRFFDFIHPFLPIAIQFAFGGLFSAFVIFYFRSAALGVSWPFVLALVVLLIGNELFKRYYSRLVFNLSILFFAIFSFSIFYLPIIVGRMGRGVFISSGIISLAVIGAFIYLLYRLIPRKILEVQRMLIAGIVGVFVVVNIFYFLNIIPPIPLSLKHIGVYHNVTRHENEYHVSAEVDDRWFQLRERVHVAPGQSVYIFSSVFAPTRLGTNIVHHWQFHNNETGKWETAGRFTFPIAGGRDGGYRGYSFKTNVQPGLWRVDVETADGRVVGRAKFRVVQVDTAVALEERVY
jgi:hypothetical protein